MQECIILQDFGDHSDQYYSVQTQEGEQIAALIAGYIDIILRKVGYILSVVFVWCGGDSKRGGEQCMCGGEMELFWSCLWLAEARHRYFPVLLSAGAM